MQPHERDFTNLVEELMRLVLAEELFTFVLEPDVEPTNNGLERQLRSPAQDRKAGRPARRRPARHRRSVIVTVLESLHANLENFNLSTVLAEVGRWIQEGISLFARQWQAMQEAELAAVPDTS